MTPDSILSVHNLSKSFSKVHAVLNTSFSLVGGQCFGLLGPNGAGKSTTLEMIQGIIKPNKGQILFLGKPMSSATREVMGVQFQSTALPPKLTTYETLDIFSRFYKNRLDIDYLIKICELKEFINRRHERLSGGQKQRLLLAIALCNDPSLILLDEPTTGLDPQARRHLWDIVVKIKSEGKTILLTTHYMDEAEKLCDEIAIMDHGTIIAKGSPQDLLTEHCKQVVIYIPKEKSPEKIGSLGLPGKAIQTPKGMEIHTKDLNKCLGILTGGAVDISGINIRQSNLDDLFLKLTGKELRP